MKHRKLAILFYISATAFLLNACASFLIGEEEDKDQDRYFAESNKDCDTEECQNADQSHVGTKASPVRGRINAAVDARDVVLGMSRTDVIRSWGEPTVREVAGRGNDGHERWRYGTRYSLQGERIVIFESGRVAGWYR